MVPSRLNRLYGPSGRPTASAIVAATTVCRHTAITGVRYRLLTTASGAGSAPVRAIPKIVRVELVVQAMHTPRPELTRAMSTMIEPPLQSRSARTKAGAVGEFASAVRLRVPQPICRPQAQNT